MKTLRTTLCIGLAVLTQQAPAFADSVQYYCGVSCMKQPAPIIFVQPNPADQYRAETERESARNRAFTNQYQAETDRYRAETERLRLEESRQRQQSFDEQLRELNRLAEQRRQARQQELAVYDACVSNLPAYTYFDARLGACGSRP